jgi:hypothetical protein
MPKKATSKAAGASAQTAGIRTKTASSSGAGTTTSKRGTGTKKTAQSREASQTPELTHEQVAQRAHDIWQASGCPWGQEDRCWFEAEHQLRQETNVQ